jgi:hypothetical protein
MRPILSIVALVGLTIQEKRVSSEVFVFATKKYALQKVL